MYHKLNDKPTVFFDVDSTLVFTSSEMPVGFTALDQLNINNRIFWVHHSHVECIKDFKARGHNVVVWSAGGADWAETVVKALGIQEYVDVILHKPAWYFDDLHVTEWIGKHCYIPINDFNPIKKD